MKVLFQSRANLFSVPGGDTIQLTKTAEFLRRQGVQVDIATESAPSLAGYDVVHLFNLMRPQEVYVQARRAKKHGCPVALSTIYGLYTEYERKARRGLAGLVLRHTPRWQIERLKVIARIASNGEAGYGNVMVALQGYKTLCGRVASLADVFLPNSHSEMKRVHADFPVSVQKPYVAVPNAVDVDVFDPHGVRVDREVRRFEGCIVSAARIEGRKCQLELVEAARDLDVDLVLIGQPAPNHVKYFEAVKTAAGPRVHFAGQVGQAQLAQFFAVAKVHALISWMETPGLSSLEAGAMGCNLVATEKGDTRDYFGDQAIYCEPDSVDSIRAAIIRAMGMPRSSGLQQRIRSEYTWQKAAEATRDGYEQALAGLRRNVMS
jgi:glycosyltransferase involved in cell wall biosynthesis